MLVLSQPCRFFPLLCRFFCQLATVCRPPFLRCDFWRHVLASSFTHRPFAERAYRLLVNALCTTCASRSAALACARYVLDMLGRSTTPPRSDVVRAYAPQSSRTCLHYGLARGWRRLRGLGVLASDLGLFLLASTVLPPPPQPCALPCCARPQETIYVRRTAL